MVKGFYCALWVLFIGCQAAQSPVHDASPLPAASAAPASASTSEPKIVAAQASAGATPANSAARTTATAAPLTDAPDAGSAPMDAALETARSVRERCASGYPIPDCYAAFPERVTCPAQLANLPRGEYCGLEGTTQPAVCPYATATCKCTHVAYCGGVTPTQLQQMGMTWVCAPPRKAGDCPETAARGGRCSVAGQQCSYGSCGSLTECTCNAGKYRCQDRIQQTPP